MRWGSSGAEVLGGGAATCHARCALEIRKCGPGRSHLCCCDSAVVAYLLGRCFRWGASGAGAWGAGYGARHRPAVFLPDF